jgi:WD40 repeat protein
VLPKEDEIVDEKNTATAASLLFANLKISHLFREGGDETPTPFPQFRSDEHSKLDPIRVPALTFHQDIPNDDNEDDELLEYPNLYEDLALALQSLTEESDTDDEGLDQIDVAAVHDDDDDDLLLPEIELDFGDDTFLSEPLQDLDHIFAESSHNSDSIWQVNRVSNNNTIIPIDLHDDGHNISDDDDALLTKTVVDPFSPKTTSSIPPLSDEEAAAFYQDLDQALQSLSIVDDDPAVNWYCQPCTPSLPLDSGPSGSFSAIRWETLTSPPRIKPPPNLAAIDEDQAVVHQDLPQGLAASLSDPTFASLNKEQKKKSTKAGDVDELLDLSLLSIADGPLYSMDLMTAEEVEDLFTDGSSDEHIMEQIYDTTTASPMVVQPQQGPPPLPQRRSNLTIRPEAVSAALPFTSAFRVAPVEGTDKAILEQQETQNHGVLQERCCLGHKGTIFGVSFSECGNFLASASQDSTVCVWNVKTNALLATLKEHSQEHECLRVAWYVYCDAVWKSSTIISWLTA